MLDEKALIHPKGVLSGRGQDSVQPVKFLHTKLTHPCLYGLCFVHWCVVMMEQEWTIPNLFPQIWELEIVQDFLLC